MLFVTRSFHKLCTMTLVYCSVCCGFGISVPISYLFLWNYSISYLVNDWYGDRYAEMTWHCREACYYMYLFPVGSFWKVMSSQGRVAENFSTEHRKQCICFFWNTAHTHLKLLLTRIYYFYCIFAKMFSIGWNIIFKRNILLFICVQKYLGIIKSSFLNKIVLHYWHILINLPCL